MSSFIPAWSWPAVVACTRPAPRPHKRVDSPTGNCGLCLPTLFQRIGIMAANGHHSPRLTTPTCIAFGSGYTPDNRRPVAIDKPSSGPIRPAKTTPAFIASGPADGLDNQKRMKAAKPSGRTSDGASRTLSGRACSGQAQPWSPSACCRHAPARAGPAETTESSLTENRMTCPPSPRLWRASPPSPRLWRASPPKPWRRRDRARADPHAGQHDRAAFRPHVRADVHGLAGLLAPTLLSSERVRGGVDPPRWAEQHAGASYAGETVTQCLTLRCPTLCPSRRARRKNIVWPRPAPCVLPPNVLAGRRPVDEATGKPCNAFLCRFVSQASGGGRCCALRIYKYLYTLEYRCAKACGVSRKCAEGPPRFPGGRSPRGWISARPGAEGQGA